MSEISAMSMSEVPTVPLVNEVSRIPTIPLHPNNVNEISAKPTILLDPNQGNETNAQAPISWTPPGEAVANTINAAREGLRALINTHKEIQAAKRNQQSPHVEPAGGVYQPKEIPG